MPGGMVGGAPRNFFLARNEHYGTQTKLGWCKLDYLTISKICSGLIDTLFFYKHTVFSTSLKYAYFF